MNSILISGSNRTLLSSVTSPLSKTKPPQPQDNNNTNTTVTTAATTKEKKVDLKTKIKQLASHYWYGTKLLGKNIGVAIKLVKRVIRGHTLTRRERTLLVQTSSDVLRLVPFLVIVIVPFLEFALPIILRFFPNLLPSTYESNDEKMHSRAKILERNTKASAFLKDTLADISVQLKSKKALNSTEFFDFMTRVKNGESVSSQEIINFSQLFSDEITLEKISRPQLLMMNKHLSGSSPLTNWYSNDFLRSQLMKKIKKIKQDDVLIKKEGLDALSIEELVEACTARGIKAEGLEREDIVSQLEQWIDLSLNKSVPPSLLILSRAFTFSPNVSAQEALEDTLEHIPQEALTEVAKELPLDLSTEQGQELAKEKLDDLNKQEEILVSIQDIPPETLPEPITSVETAPIPITTPTETAVSKDKESATVETTPVASSNDTTDAATAAPVEKETITESIADKEQQEVSEEKLEEEDNPRQDLQSLKGRESEESIVDTVNTKITPPPPPIEQIQQQQKSSPQ
eukprot:gene8056-9911_t